MTDIEQEGAEGLKGPVPAKTPAIGEVKHLVIGPYRNTAKCISAIAQFADDDPDREAVVMGKATFLRLIGQR
jgi:hypothetical protein